MAGVQKFKIEKYQYTLEDVKKGGFANCIFATLESQKSKKYRVCAKINNTEHLTKVGCALAKTEYLSIFFHNKNDNHTSILYYLYTFLSTYNQDNYLPLPMTIFSESKRGYY